MRRWREKVISKKLIKGKRTEMTKNQLRWEIKHRMEALDTTDEEYSNKELVDDYKDLCRGALE